MVISYLKAFSNVLFRPLKVSQRPIHIQLEPTTYCNLNCRPCWRSKYLPNLGHLTPEHFTRIIDQIRPSKISLSGSGEPLLNPHLFDLLNLAKEYGCSINTTSNGTLLTPERCVQLVKSGLALIKISIDGATPETYQKIRREDRFLQIIDGIRTLTDVKKQFGSRTPYIRFNYVVSKENYAEIGQTVKLAHKLGVNAIYFQPLQLSGVEERYADLVGDLTYAALAQEITQALKIGQYEQVQTNLLTFSQKLPLYWKRYQLAMPPPETRICVLPWFSAYITLDGFVRPCCACIQESTNMGNLLESTLAEVWNGAKYQQFRKAIREGKRPFAICKDCVPQTLQDFVQYSKILPGFLR